LTANTFTREAHCSPSLNAGGFCVSVN